MTHRHPRLLHPVPPSLLEAELAELWARGRATRPPRIVPTEALSRTHARNDRRYAETDGRTIYVAPEILLLPRAQRIGILAHEAGHVVLFRREHSEADADEAARLAFGVEVKYDRRWGGGRGLQSAR